MTRKVPRVDPKFRRMISKVPEVTAYFWVIKVLCTTVGETAADYLNETLHFGLTGTSLVAGVLLIGSLVAQFRNRRYSPPVYWMTVVLISVVGTLITDNLTDGMGISLVTTTIVFAAALALTFVAWFATEGTLSVHTIYSARREAFYWLTILFTFALGTAAGDLVAERFGLGYLPSVGLFAGLIAVVAIAHAVARSIASASHHRRSANAVLAFWMAYILTRPLGASIGDYLAQDKSDGGLGLGTTLTSAIFLSAILALVAYLALTRKDQIEVPADAEPTRRAHVAANRAAAELEPSEVD